MRSWRERLEPFARAALAALPPETTLKQKRAALREAWERAGGGPRRYWPYRVWLDVCAKLLGKREGRIPRRSAKAKAQRAADEQNLTLPWFV